MKTYITLFGLIATLPFISAHEGEHEEEEEHEEHEAGGELPECAVTCINKGIDVGLEQDCSGKADLECLCANPDVGETIRDCAYSECTEDEHIQSIIDYVFHVCEDEAGVTITVETTPPTASASAAPDATGSSETPSTTEEAEAPEEPPVTVNGGTAMAIPAAAALFAAAGFALLLA